MSTEDTNTIDEKKNNTSNEKQNKIYPFLINYLIFTIGFIIIFIFVLGSVGLYTTKVAQSNILPDNINLAPFTTLKRNVENIDIDINVVKPWFQFFSSNTDETISQKIDFNSAEYLESFEDSFLETLKSYANPQAGIFANSALYYSKVYDSIVATNFSVINTIFYYLSFLPESVIMLLYSIFSFPLFFIVYGLSYVWTFFFHLINLPQFFRAASENNKYNWEPDNKISFLRIIPLILFWFNFIGAIISACVSPIFFTLYAFLSPLFISANLIIEPSKKKKYSLFNLIIDSFNYKSKFFLDLATIGLIISIFKNFTLNFALAIIPALIILYIIGEFRIENPEKGVDGFTKAKGVQQAIINKGSRTPPTGEETESFLSQPIQSGGKKGKSKGKKKYNIRFV